MITQIDHIGVAVRSLDDAVAFYERTFGLRCLHREEVPSQKVRTALIDIGGIRLELLEPMDPNSPVARFLADRGEGLHHIALQTDNLAGQLAQAAGAGARLLNEKPIEGAAGRLVAFLHPKSTHGVLTELCASKPA
jgi:methylmalonyl-CoA/ethylmalonyl-CoA epimerase